MHRTEAVLRDRSQCADIAPLATSALGIASIGILLAGLMSYGPNISDLFRRAGEYVDKILRGAKAGELPVEQPTKFELVVNLTVAKALGFKLTESFLLRADEVIE